MTKSEINVSEALNEWIEVFMKRSMRDSMRFWKESRLSMPQISTLMRVYFRGNCSVTEVGTYLHVTPPAASQMIDNLVHSGFVERTEHPSDRRTKLLKLTDTGRGLVKKSLEARRRWLVDLVESLGTDEQMEIASALAQLTKAAREADIENDSSLAQPD